MSRFFSVLLGIYRWFRAFILNALFLLLLLLLFSPLLPQTRTPVPRDAALVLNPAGLLVEQLTLGTSLDQLMQQSTGDDDSSGEVLLQDILDAIELAQDDDNIKALVLATDNFQGGGFSHLRDVAQALQEFRTSGKPVYAIGASFNQAQYYLASQADEIIMNPLGAVELEGFGAWQLYYRDALDKLGVNAHIFRVGEFKAAVEPYERNDMSPEAKANYGQLLEELWSLYLADIGARRQLDAATLNDYINRMDEHLAAVNGDTAQLALTAALVDRVESRPANLEYLRERIGRDGDSFRRITFKNYLSRVRSSKEQQATGNRIALIVASGEIRDGDANPGTVGGRTLATLIREARNDERLRALVLRIDSPGGSVSASEEIREELLAYKETGRPVVVSMGSVAASGGYWIATPATEIWADAATITGSIGIYGVVPTLEDSMDKLGLNVDGVGTTDLSGAGNLLRPLSPLMERSVQHVIQNGYDRFIGLVADARGMSLEQVDAIAQGQIWTGQTAQQLGLVDNLGSLQEALDAAAMLVGFDEYAINLLEPRLSPLQQFLRQLLDNTAVRSLTAAVQERMMPAPLLRGALESLQQQTRLLQLDSDPRSAYVHCLECRNLLLW